MKSIKETIDGLEDPPSPQRWHVLPEGVRILPVWEATGRTRYRVNLLGKIILMVEERRENHDSLASAISPQFYTRWRDATQLDLLMTVAVPREARPVIPWTGAADVTKAGKN